MVDSKEKYKLFDLGVKGLMPFELRMSKFLPEFH